MSEREVIPGTVPPLRWFTAQKRDVLIDHLDGVGVPIYRRLSHEDSWRAVTARALLNQGLIRTDGRQFPRHTFITELGRAALVKVLADYADALIKAGRAFPAPLPADAPKTVENRALFLV